MFANLENNYLPILKIHTYVKEFCEGKDGSVSSMKKIFRAVVNSHQMGLCKCTKGLYREKSLLWFLF